MKRKPYTFTVVRYVHDAAAGETLNVGVLVYSREARYVRLRVETRYQRLSDTFRGFDGDLYRSAIRRLIGEVERLRDRFITELPFEDLPVDVGTLGARIWSDPDASFRFGPTLSGITQDLDDAADNLFERMVTSQTPETREERRTDEEVWAAYKQPLERTHVAAILQSRSFKSQTAVTEIKFDHAFKNEKWHALRPLSLDLARAETMQRKAAQWIGYGTVLQEVQNFGTVYFLLGPPESHEQRVPYEKAKLLLNRTPVTHEIIEEDGAEDFATSLARELQKHGVLDETG